MEAEEAWSLVAEVCMVGSLLTGSGCRDWVRSSVRLQSSPSGPLLPERASPFCVKVPQSLKTAPPAEDQTSKLRSLQGTFHIHITMLCLYLAAQALNAYFVLIRVISTKDERVYDLMRAHLLYNAPAASLRSADNCAISFHKKQRKVPSHQWAIRTKYSRFYYQGVPNPYTQQWEITYQYFPLLETFYFPFLWVLWDRSLLSWVPSMLCAWPTQGERSHPRESVLKVKAGPLFNDYSGANLTGPGKWKRHLREQSPEKEKPGTTEPHMGFWAGPYSTKVERTHKCFDQNRKILAQIL